ncbi:MAG TPA: S8 family serine peptidase [Methylomirabilota bacterium]|nr:S8 family serine peptidase [Methylomirabilota bacterium]
MFFTGRTRNLARSLRANAALALLLTLALVAGLGAQQSVDLEKFANLKSARAGDAKALSMPPAPGGLPATLSPELRSSAAGIMSPGRGASVASPQGAGPGSTYYFLVRAEFDSAASRQRLSVSGATLLTAYDRFAEIFIPLGKDGKGPDQEVLKAFFAAPGLVWIDYPEPIEVPPIQPLRAAPPTRAVPEQIVRGGYAGLTGKGVIVAVLDSGIDFRNRDFITYDAGGRPTSRLLYFWDTVNNSFASSHLGGKPPYSFPNGVPIGTLYSRQQLTDELASGAKRIPATDENGHGTAATGLAAGNGNNARDNVGVAPDADIIGVRIGGSSGSLENAYLMNAAIAWVDSVAKAEGKPVVFSCSFGGHRGGHDGASVEERELNARFAAAVPGRALVIAAGNEQRAGIHAQQAFQGNNAPAVFAWNSEKGAYLALFLHAKSNGPVPDPKQIMLAPLVLNDQGQKLPEPQLANAYQNPLSHDLVLEFISPANWAGLVVWTSSGQPVVADAYVLGGAFHQSIQRVAEIVGTPGTSAGAITVGSYDWNDQFSYQGKVIAIRDACGNSPMQLGNLSCYSSVGYSRGGNVKPDITSPGQWYSSSYAHNPDGSGVGPEHNIVDTSGNYMLFNGTSAATPYTAGIIALMMQKKPGITSGEVKSLLQRNATQDSFTGAVPNLGWGYGKLDLAAVRAILNAIR